MKRFEGFVKWYNNRFVGIWSYIFTSLSAVALVSLVFIISVYILLRKFTELRIYFVEEWSAYLLVLIVYFTITYTLMTKGHVIVDVVVRYLSEMINRVLQLLIGLIGMIMVGYLLQRSLSFFLYQLEDNIVSPSIVHTPMWIPTLFVPLGLTLFGLGMLGYSLQKVVDVVNYAKEKRNVSLPANSKG